MVGRHKIGARLIQTGMDVEQDKYQFRADALYLEITHQTSQRDVEEIWKHVKKYKKELYPYALPKPEAIARRVWYLTLKKIPDKEIAKYIRGEFPSRKTFGYNDVPIYRKRYKDALTTLKQLNTN